MENSRLRKLELFVGEDISPLLHSLTLPALEQFTCYIDNDEVVVPIPNLPFESLLHFLTRSHCKLKGLTLGDWKLSGDEFIECLEHEASETIQELRIDFWPTLTDDVLLRLTYPPSPTAPRILLPKLARLKLEYCLYASPGILGKMVSSRHCPETDEMEEMEDLVLLVHDLDEEDETIIKDLAADGLRTRVLIMNRSFDSASAVVLPSPYSGYG